MKQYAEIAAAGEAKFCDHNIMEEEDENENKKSWPLTCYCKDSSETCEDKIQKEKKEPRTH